MQYQHIALLSKQWRINGHEFLQATLCPALQYTTFNQKFILELLQVSPGPQRWTFVVEEDFLQAEYPSCHQNNGVKAQKETL